LIGKLYNESEQMATTFSAINLKRQVITALRQQGYTVKKDGSFALKENDLEARRKAHELAKLERVVAHKDFIIGSLDLIKPHLIDGAESDA